MTFVAQFVGFAETAAVDPRGNLTLSGFSPQYIAVDSFPAQIAPFFIVTAESEDLPSGEAGAGNSNAPDAELAGTVELQVTSPDGEVLFYTTQQAVIARQLVKGVPSRLVLVAQVPIAASKPGNYTFKIVVTGPFADAPKFEAARVLRVFDAEQIRSAMPR